MHARLCYTDAALGRDRAASRAWRVRSHDTEKTLAVDVYAVVHLQRDANGAGVVAPGSSLAIGRLRAATSQALRAECPGGQSKKPGREVVDTGGRHANSAVNR
jgi:hypothetical protein